MLSKRLQTTLHNKNPFQCCANTVVTTLHRQKPYEMLSKRLQTTLHWKKSYSMLFQCAWDNIGQVKTLWNVIKKAPDNIVHEKILLNVVVILLGEHCASKNPLQCYPRDCRQHCTGNPMHCRLNNITFLRFLFWTG